MSVNSPQMVSVTCPVCRTQYSAPVQTVVDVGQEPRLKAALIQGRLNVGVCPQCGAAGFLTVPFIYHDPEKELLFVLAPQEMQMNENERQRVIGQMTNAIINSLPTEQRKGYLLQPRVFLTRQSLIEAILEADGITREMLQAQQEKARIIGEMAEIVDDPLRLASLIGEHKEKIDRDFFSLLTANIRIAEQSAQDEVAEKLAKLREILLERTEVGQEVAEQEAALERAVAGLDEDITREELLERVVSLEGEHSDQILNVLIAMARPLIDYRFFQLLMQRIQEAEESEDADLAQRLKDLRDKILDLTQRLDAELRDRVQEKAQLLSEIIRSPDRKATIRSHLDEIDGVLMSVLESNIVQSEQQQPETAELLRDVRDTIVEVLRESAPPQIRLIDELVNADYPEGTRKLLSDNLGMVDDELLALMEVLAQSLADQGDEEASEQLKGIQAQAALMRT